MNRVESTDSFASKTCIRLGCWSGMAKSGDGTEKETFDMSANTSSEHLVPQFGQRLDYRRLECVARVGADSSLRQSC